MAHAPMVGGEANRRLGAAGVTMEPSDLLGRLSATLRSEIGPAVGDEYTRTQAFMASVILAKVAKEVALGPDHRAAERADMVELHQRLEPILGVGPPAPVLDAAAAARSSATVAGLGPLVEALHRWGADQPGADRALAAIRTTLRRDVDRRMEVAS